MKKRMIFILSVISLILTFIFAQMLSIYHFGSIPTLLSSIYLISIFSVLEYLFVSGSYIIGKLIKKEKIKANDIIGLILLFLALLLLLMFLIIINIDWLNWYVCSSPFYLSAVVRGMEFLLPSIIFIIIGVSLLKKKSK